MLRFSLSRFIRVSSKPSSMSAPFSANSATGSVPVVKHNAKESKFYIQLDGNDKAILEYAVVKNGALDMYHTEVPPGYQGKGLAGILAKAAFDHAVEQNVGMILSCTYLQKYYKDHPEEKYKKLVIP